MSAVERCCAVVCLVAGGLVALCGIIAPAWSQALVHEMGPVQCLQAALLGAAATAFFQRMWHERRVSGLSPLGCGLTALCGLLAWREIELDNELFGRHAFSWGYLGSETPWTVQCLLGVPSLACVAACGLVLVGSPLRRWRFDLGRHAPALRLVGCGLLLLAASQLWDKGSTLIKHCGTTFFIHGDREPNPLPEEVLELWGDVCLMGAAWQAGGRRRPARTRSRPTPAACLPTRGDLLPEIVLRPNRGIENARPVPSAARPE